ncbi:hypothetical protein ACTXT7_010739 [Hymenolepis weldensis]
MYSVCSSGSEHGCHELMEFELWLIRTSHNGEDFISYREYDLAKRHGLQILGRENMPVIRDVP